MRTMLYILDSLTTRTQSFCLVVILQVSFASSMVIMASFRFLSTLRGRSAFRRTWAKGSTVRPAVHRLDAAHLYRLVLEKGSAEARYHGIAEDGVPFREIAGVIARRLNVPVVSKTPEQAAEHFAWFAHFAALDNTASSQRTREQLGWHAKQPGLIADIDRPSYFAT